MFAYSLLDTIGDPTLSAAYQSQLVELRRSYTDRLQHQLQSMLQSAGSVSGRILHHIHDLQRWLVWEATWRQIEKIVANTQITKQEQQSQDQFVRIRLLEEEVAQVLEQNAQRDQKLRGMDTIVAQL